VQLLGPLLIHEPFEPDVDAVPGGIESYWLHGVPSRSAVRAVRGRHLANL